MEKSKRISGKLALGIFAFMAGVYLLTVSYTLIGIALLGLSMWLITTL